MIQFDLAHPRTTFKQFAKGLNAPLKKGSEFKLSKSLGEGWGFDICIEEGLYLTVFKLTFNNDFVAIRKPVKKAEYHQVIYWFSEENATIDIKKEKKDIGKKTLSGIIFASPKIQGVIQTKANTLSVNINITFSKAWAKKNKLQSILKFISPESVYHIHDEIDIETAYILNQLESINTKALSPLKTQGLVYQLISVFNEKLSTRDRIKLKTIMAEDVMRLFQAKHFIDNNVEQPITIKQLSRTIGMSESKFQKIFQHSFNFTVYKYIQRAKMQYAKTLLEESRLSISEIGYKVGYNNLSHFARVFKERYGTVPSKVRKQQ